MEASKDFESPSLETISFSTSQPLCNVSSWPSASAFIAIRTGWVGAPSKDTIISHKTFASHYVAARFMAGNLSGCPLGTLLTPLWIARRATVHSNHFYLPKCHNLGFDSQGRYKKKSCVGSKEGSFLVNTHIYGSTAGGDTHDDVSLAFVPHCLPNQDPLSTCHHLTGVSHKIRHHFLALKFS